MWCLKTVDIESAPWRAASWTSVSTRLELAFAIKYRETEHRKDNKTIQVTCGGSRLAESRCLFYAWGLSSEPLTHPCFLAHWRLDGGDAIQNDLLSVNSSNGELFRISAVNSSEFQPWRSFNASQLVPKQIQVCKSAPTPTFHWCEQKQILNCGVRRHSLLRYFIKRNMMWFQASDLLRFCKNRVHTYFTLCVPCLIF